MLLRKNNSYPRILYPAKYLFQTESELDISNQQRLRVCHSMTFPERSTIGFTSVRKTIDSGRKQWRAKQGWIKKLLNIMSKLNNDLL